MISSMSMAVRARPVGARSLSNFAFKACSPSTHSTSKQSGGDFLSALDFEKEVFGSAADIRGMAQRSTVDPVASLEKALDAMMFEDVVPKSFASNSFGSKMPQRFSHAVKMQAPEARLDFDATHDWQLLPKNVICPPGLQFKVDLSTNTTLARLQPIE